MADDPADENHPPGPPRDALPPGGASVGFLLSQVGAAVARQFREVISVTELEPRQFALLQIIARREGATQNAVSEELGIPASSLVSVVDHLEAALLVERRVHSEDRRSRSLHLTGKGREVLETATGLAWGFEAHLCAVLIPEERALLIGLLERIGRRLDVTPDVHLDMSLPNSAPLWANTERVPPS
jgi:DNA-binding MarR family transcriptional regulator